MGFYFSLFKSKSTYIDAKHWVMKPSTRINIIRRTNKKAARKRAENLHAKNRTRRWIFQMRSSRRSFANLIRVCAESFMARRSRSKLPRDQRRGMFTS